MNCLLIYDIPDDRRRTKIADACLDYGLDRIQYSAFSGDISRNLQAELFLKVCDILGKKPGNIQIIPVCQRDWRNRMVWEKEDEGVKG
ncbi:MAG: CRISPR-associated endonuclease Cas2 [Chloroflexi bacterium]|nr:CRISPR-associated endonuclease Cas2 [Chloroflexota bacterium]